MVHGRVTRRVCDVTSYESVCDVSRGSYFASRDDERVKRLQIRGHGGIVQRKKFTTMPYRCVAVNCCNVVDICLNVYLYTTYLPLAIKQPFRENTTGPTTGQVITDSSNSFSGICLDGNC